jgi:hypothetical protein
MATVHGVGSCLEGDVLDFEKAVLRICRIVDMD